MDDKIYIIRRSCSDYILDFFFFVLKCLFVCSLPFLLFSIFSLVSPSAVHSYKQNFSFLPVVRDVSAIDLYVDSIDDLLKYN